MLLELPPPAFYSERQELVKAVREWAGTHGYAAMITRSNEVKGFVYIACDMSGSRRNTLKTTPLAEQRERGSRRDNCLFLVVGHCRDDV